MCAKLLKLTVGASSVSDTTLVISMIAEFGAFVGADASARGVSTV